MTNLKTLAVCVALAAGGVLLGANYPVAVAQIGGGAYSISSANIARADYTGVWRINSRGQVSLCMSNIVAILEEKRYEIDGRNFATCSKWTER